MSYKVKLDVFEGPFDLLVYLIENAQMNIYDIQIAEITEQYLDYLDRMQKLDVAIATEFMVLASELIEIKSKLLIPRVSLEAGVTEEEDPRSELVERILEYKRFKKAAELLADAEERSMLIFEKPQEDISEYLNQPDEYLHMDLEHFVNAFNMFLHKKHKIAEVKKRYQRIEREKISVEQRIAHIWSFFTGLVPRKKVTFTELISDKPDRGGKVVTFASLLEMAKSKLISFEQEELYGEITVVKQDPEQQPPEGNENMPVSENGLDGEPTAYSVGTEREALV